jgi:hypothetical protein
MTTSSYLGGQSGVQYNGIETDDGGYPKFNLQNALLVGEFKRGPFDRPFKVTKETMEAQLSYDYANPYYIALEDAFKTGAEYVWVMRVDTNVYVWSDWQIDTNIAIQNNQVHYTAYKTNGKVTFDSFAEVDLTEAIVRSLHDSDMQQWQAVNDACNELTGVTNWVFDPANNQIKYYPVGEFPSDPNYQWLYHGVLYNTPQEACETFWAIQGNGWVFHSVSNPEREYPVCVGYKESENRYDGYQPTERRARVDPIPEPEEKYLHLAVVAQKILSNASSSNQAISLLAEAYLENITNSIFNGNESKQFVKLTDLIQQFEANKTQR